VLINITREAAHKQFRRMAASQQALR